MPSPVFIICSEGGSIDRHTNSLSIYDVIDKIAFRVVDPRDSGKQDGPAKVEGRLVSVNSLRMTAVWRQSAGDEGQVFEFKTVIRMPGADEIVAGKGELVFKTPLHRVLSTFQSEMPKQSGEISVKSLIRRLPDGEWIQQEYVIPVERIDPGAKQPKLPMTDG